MSLQSSILQGSFLHFFWLEVNIFKGTQKLVETRAECLCGWGTKRKVLTNEKGPLNVSHPISLS